MRRGAVEERDLARLLIRHGEGVLEAAVAVTELVAATLLAVLLGGQGPFRGTNATFIFLVAGAAAAVSPVEAVSPAVDEALPHPASSAAASAALIARLNSFFMVVSLSPSGGPRPP